VSFCRKRIMGGFQTFDSLRAHDARSDITGGAQFSLGAVPFIIQRAGMRFPAWGKEAGRGRSV
jgi:hypothetical protein